jgi:acetoin utilization protein AcuC
MTKAALIASPDLWKADRGPNHPLKAERLTRTWDLLHAYEAFASPNAQLVSPRPATEKELAWFHTPDYIQAVQELGQPDPNRRKARRYGFGPGDNPISEHMYEIERLKVGGGLVAADLVASGQVDVAFNVGGGMHHAKAAQASGFCIFNDPVITIQSLLHRDWRVAYIDIDAHHGDGVQEAFYDTDQVLTISLHELGKFFFPGTGHIEETGRESGRGYAINIPFPPYTGDDGFVWAFEEIVPAAIDRFAPDAIVAQLGADTHFTDPLTHMTLSTHGFAALVEMINGLGTRWIALGGGGYSMTAVPRAWTLAYGIMSDQVFPDPLPAAYSEKYEPGTLSDHALPAMDAETQRLISQRITQSVEHVKATHKL